MPVLSDSEAMRQAIAEGERGRLTAPPNPWVGCVITSGGDVVGRGFHLRPGEPHAEAAALADAGDTSRGATVYSTLEPCVHEGRTPPCVEALIAAGVGRVVIGVEDPDARVRGAGVDVLRRAGINVEIGVETDAARHSLRAYLHQRTHGIPWLVLKAAMSVDGRIAAVDGSSQWITGDDARADAHRLRAESQAIVVGSGTASNDTPALTVRSLSAGAIPEPADQPLRVVLDSTGGVPPEGPLFDPTLAPTLVITTSQADDRAVRAWKEAGAEVAEVAAAPDGGVDLPATLDLLGRRGVLQVLVEGGATLHGALLSEGMGDEMVVYVGGLLLGDDAVPLARGLQVASIADAPRWVLGDVAWVGDDARLVWRRS